MNNSQRQATISGQLAKATAPQTSAEKLAEAFATVTSKKGAIAKQEIALIAAYDRQLTQINLAKKAVLLRLQTLSIAITEESK